MHEFAVAVVLRAARLLMFFYAQSRVTGLLLYCHLHRKNNRTKAWLRKRKIEGAIPESIIQMT